MRWRIYAMRISHAPIPGSRESLPRKRFPAHSLALAAMFAIYAAWWRMGLILKNRAGYVL
jgi:hypothetical protein